MTRPGLSLEECLGREAHALQRPRHEVLDHGIGGREQPLQHLEVMVALEVEGDAALVPAVGLPEHLDVVDPPAPQVVAAIRVLDLDHVGAEVGEHVRDHVAGDEPGQVDDANAAQRAGWLLFGRNAHPLPAAGGSRRDWRLLRPCPQSYNVDRLPSTVYRRQLTSSIGRT